jgi:TRAP transporter TAXI family solute receptor
MRCIPVLRNQTPPLPFNESVFPVSASVSADSAEDQRLQRTIWTILAGALAVISIAWVVFFFYGRPTVIRVAVTRDSVDHQIISSAAKLLQRERSSIRLKTVLVADPATSAKALESGNADLAVTRTDLGQPLNGKAMVIMRKSAAVIVAPQLSKISTIAGLKGKRIGIVSDDEFSYEDRRLLGTILTHYDIPTKQVAFVPLEMAQISAAISAGMIDAVFVIGVATSSPVAEVVSIVAGAGKGEPNLLSIQQSYAIAQSSPAITAAKIMAGAFGGATPRPAKSVESVAVTTLLMADSKLKDTVVSTLTRSFFALKPKIAASIPDALRMEAPSTSKDAALPVHPGAAAFLDGEDLSLMMRYGDFIYLGAMVLSMIGSAIAALLSRANTSGRRRMDGILARLMAMLAEIRMADNPAMLKLAELEADAIVSRALTGKEARGLEADMVSALGLAVGQVREAIRDRQAELARSPSAQHPSIRIVS